MHSGRGEMASSCAKASLGSMLGRISVNSVLFLRCQNKTFLYWAYSYVCIYISKLAWKQQIVLNQIKRITQQKQKSTSTIWTDN